MLPTVNVSLKLTDQSGKPLASIEVQALLNTQERFEGFIVPKTTTARTNSSGEIIMSLFPNELGASGSHYLFIYKVQEKEYKVKAVIPNTDCNLWDIATLPTYPPSSAGDIIIADVLKARDEAIEAADRAESAVDVNIPLATVDVAGIVKPDNITISVTEDGTIGVIPDSFIGDEGKSNYDLWIEQGNIGTIDEYLATLKGLDGTNGLDGSINGYNTVAIQGGDGVLVDTTNNIITISLDTVSPFSLTEISSDLLMVALGTGFTILDHSIKENGNGLFLYMKIVKSNGTDFTTKNISIPLVLSGNKTSLQDYHLGVCTLYKDQVEVGIGSYRVGGDNNISLYIPVACSEICLQLYVPNLL